MCGCLDSMLLTQKRTLDPMEKELKMDGSGLMETEPGSTARIVCSPNH